MTIKVYRNFSEIVTLASAYKKDGRKLNPTDVDIIKNGSLVFDQNEILWVGPESKFPEEYSGYEYVDVEGKTCTPEIVDAHTHLIFGGDRSQEYIMRLNGASYEEIAACGGGIVFTANATKALSRIDLFRLGQQRVRQIHSYGIGTIEIKTGYGLTYDKELELAHVIQDLKKFFSPEIQIKSTFMAAHAIPPEFKSSYEYMQEVVLPLLDKLSEENLVDAVDVFHEQNYFSDEDVRALFERANRLGIPAKLHADELNDNNGAQIAVDYKCLSADHLLKISDSNIELLANSKTVANLLPGTGFFLGKPQAPARKLLDAGVKVSISSDYNPGSCHCDNLILIASLAAKTYGLNFAELWSAITLNASHALGIHNQGAIIPGLAPRFSFFNCDSASRIFYSWGRNFSSNAKYN